MTMADFTDDLQTTTTAKSNYHSSSDAAWERTDCGFCSASSLYVVARTSTLPTIQWLRCPNCRLGSVINDGIQAPGVQPLPTPEGVPEAEATLWQQVRGSLSVGAYTGAAMLCRKLLLHIAYTSQRVADPSAKPMSNFASAVDYLQSQGIILASHKAWVDQIRKLGNRANHELPNIDAEEAENIARFTHQLFVNLYEMPSRANLDNPLVGDAAAPNQTPEDENVSPAK